MKELFNRESVAKWRRVWLGLLVLFVLVGISIGGLVGYASSYPDSVIPGVYIGDISIGGMHRDELKRFLNDMNDKLVSEGFRLLVETSGSTNEFIFYPVVVTETNSFELITIDIDAEVERFVSLGKAGGIFSRARTVLATRLGEPRYTLQSITSDDDAIVETISDYVSEYEVQPKNAGFNITSLSPFAYERVTSTQGLTYTFDFVPDEMRKKWAVLESPDIHLSPNVQEPAVRDEDIAPLVDRVEPVFGHGGMTLTYTTPLKRQLQWSITPTMLTQWLEIIPNESSVAFSLDAASLTTFLQETVGSSVNAEPRNAKFSVSGGKATEFQGSRPGVKLNIEQTQEDVVQAFMSRTWDDDGLVQTIPLVVDKVEPEVKTEEVNDLGITEVLGTGVSSYAGSPRNRILNIRNAVQRLNGILVKPGEEFSAITYTQPYTIEGGYLPELVIKGDEIKPEIGGGLCQIGTTLFRMAMNSGMDITQRRNHSLVVNYYNDPLNGLPGTDATIYDPNPDFRFRNDTDNHILVQTYMDEANQELHFTIWGTNDGREASYTAPVVSRWIPYGEPRIIKTTKLQPGQRECQHAYTGADAVFTYSRILASGEVENRVFESHYRPLPQICLVGVTEEELQCETDEEGECLAKEDGEQEDEQETEDEQTEEEA